MDPLSALIGGGMSLIGSMMNTSSTQSINAANIQNQMWSAQGGYLPGLVANANKAGLNPLAVLGSRGPNMAVQVGTQPGEGLKEAGRDISRIDTEARDLTLQGLREDVLQKAAVNKNTMIDAAIKEKTLSDLESGRTISGPQPASATSLSGSLLDWSSRARGPIFGPNLPASTEPWSWYDYGRRLWNDSGNTFR